MDLDAGSEGVTVAPRTRRHLMRTWWIDTSINRIPLGYLLDTSWIPLGYPSGTS